MTYNFDKFIDRKNTLSMKWDFQKEHMGYSCTYPMWVADTDFKVCNKFNEVFKKVSEIEVFGYTERDETYFSSIKNWYKRRYNWVIENNQIETTFGIIYSIGLLFEIISEKGDEIIIHSPVYNNFKNIIEEKERKVLDIPLLENKNYSMDFDLLEKSITHRTKALIMCNPHNPIGKVWKENELLKLIQICKKYNIFIISDEIHGDLTFNKYIPLGSITDYKNIAICTSPSKAFNIVSMKIANIIIKNTKVKEALTEKLKVRGFDNYNIFSLKACEVAYNECETWLEEQNTYIEKNHIFLRDFIKINIPKLKVYTSEASFLAWIDCRELNLSNTELKTLFTKKL
ncbi:MAG: MalY/PatB family protein, partial [Cetobacterium sp.]